MLAKIKKDIVHLIEVNPSIDKDLVLKYIRLITYIVYLEKVYGDKLYHVLNYNNDYLLKYFNEVVLADPNAHINIKNLMKYLSDYLNYDFHIINITIILKVIQKTV